MNTNNLVTSPFWGEYMKASNHKKKILDSKKRIQSILVFLISVQADGDIWWFFVRKLPVVMLYCLPRFGMDKKQEKKIVITCEVLFKCNVDDFYEKKTRTNVFHWRKRIVSECLTRVWRLYDFLIVIIDFLLLFWEVFYRTKSLCVLSLVGFRGQTNNRQ